MIIKKIIKYVFFIYSVVGFNLNTIIQKPYIINNNPRIYNPKIYMNYDPLKDYDQKLTIISSFQATIIINNWLNYLYSNGNRNENNNKNIINIYPAFILKPIYDMKSMISINKIDKNIILFAWCPKINIYQQSNIAYIIYGKRYNNTLYIYRIAQSPYYSDILSLNSKDLVEDIKDIVRQSPNITNINYNELHQYDNRFLLSWRIL